MAVAAYGSLASLTQVLEQIQKHHDWGRIVIDTQQVQNLLDVVDFLIELLDLHSQEMTDDIGDVSRRISLAVIEAEAVIDHNVVDQLRGVFDEESDKGLSSFHQDLEDILQEMESIKQEMESIKLESDAVQYQRPVNFVPAAASSVHHTSKTNQVGFDDRILQIKMDLTTDMKSRQVICIVGMGGIGKTTLAQCVFEDPYIKEQFDKLLWCTVSQQYNVQQILQGLLDDKTNHDKYKLGERLYKSLCGYKYLIVMDDIWSSDSWNELKYFFPEQNNGSRVMVTTRLLNVAEDISSRAPYHMSLLNKDQSWDLLCEKVFGQEDCPTDLREIGKEISTSCCGLPLSIVAIGGVLSKSNTTPEYWASVAKDVTRIASLEDDERCMKIISWSYRKLPIHLKACFLYFDFYPPGPVFMELWTLIQIFVVGGLVKSVPGKRLEDVVMEYLGDLTSRSLFTRFNAMGHYKIFEIHDLVLEFRRRELARQMRIQTPSIQDIYDKDEHVCFMCVCQDALSRLNLEDILFGTQSSNIDDISVCQNCMIRYPRLCRSRLVKVFDRNSIPRVAHPTTLRFVKYAAENRGCSSSRLISPSPILFLWNLQHLVMIVPFEWGLILPSEIWEMRQLQVLEAPNCLLPCPSSSTIAVMDQLHSLYISNMRCTEVVVERIRNLLRLQIKYDESFDSSLCGFDNLACFHHLSTLNLRARKLSGIDFPCSVEVLSLQYVHLSREDLFLIVSLTKLETLELWSCNFREGEWRLDDDTEFVRLRALVIYHSNLKCWSAYNEHFPKLESLTLALEKHLELIPSSIGDIPTLHEINLHECSELIVESARKILEDQLDMGNEDLKLHIY